MPGVVYIAKKAHSNSHDYDMGCLNNFLPFVIFYENKKEIANPYEIVADFRKCHVANRYCDDGSRQNVDHF